MMKITDTHWINEEHVSEVHLLESGGPSGEWTIDFIMQSGERFCVESGQAADRDGDAAAHSWLEELGWAAEAEQTLDALCDKFLQ